MPQLIACPGMIQPGTRINQMMSHQDWLPTLLAAAGEPDVKEWLAEAQRRLGKLEELPLAPRN